MADLTGGKEAYDAFLAKGSWDTDEQRNLGRAWMGSEVAAGRQSGGPLGSLAMNNQGQSMGSYDKSGDIVQSQQVDWGAEARAGNPVIGGTSPNMPAPPKAGGIINGRTLQPLGAAPGASNASAPTQSPALQSMTASSFVAPNGNTYSITGRNPDGTINWTSSGGQSFNNVTPQVFDQFFPGQSGSFYGQPAGQPAMNPGTQNASSVTNVTNAPIDTVAGRVAAITAQDGPLMQQARGAAMQQMNERGLINSSIAAGAAQDAVIRAAMPMAQQDAGAANFVNNRTSEQSFTQGRDATQQGYTQANMGLQNQYQTSMQNLQNAFAGSQNQLSRDFTARLQQMSTSSAAGMQLSNQYIVSATSILSDPNLSPEAKQTQLNALYNNFNVATQVAGAAGAIDLSRIGPLFATPAAPPPPPPPPTPSPGIIDNTKTIQPVSPVNETGQGN